MRKYVQQMLQEFPIKFNKDAKQTTPAGVDMFNADESKKLNDSERETFHRSVAQGLFLLKRARLDIQPIVSVLCTRVKKPGRKDWRKIVRMMKYLNATKDDVITIKHKMEYTKSNGW